MIRAYFYDGRTSGARDAFLSVAPSGKRGELMIRIGASEMSVALASVTIGERVGDTNRLLQLTDGASLEVLDNGAFDLALEAAGVHTAEAPIRRLESRWRYALLAVLATLIGSVLMFRFGVPALSARAVRFIPEGVDALVGADSLRVLDQSAFRPTQLTAQRQAQLRRVFAEVAAGASPDSSRYRLEFRDGNRIGANALALPSGIVVLTDQLEHLATDDDQLRGVFAHEMGHLVHRHAMRMLVQSSASALLVLGLFGDASAVSSLAIAAPTVLLSAAYSRDFERDADLFALGWMTAHRVDPRGLGHLLVRLDAQRGADGGGYLASHPALRERLKAMHLDSETDRTRE